MSNKELPVFTRVADERIAELEGIISEALSNMEYLPSSLGRYWLVPDKDIQALEAALLQGEGNE